MRRRRSAIMNVILKSQVFMVVPSNPSTPTLPLRADL